MTETNTPDIIAANGIKLFRNANEFSLHIEERAIKENKSCTDIIIGYQDAHGIEADEIAKYVSSSLRGKLEVEFTENGMLAKRPSVFD